MFVVADPAADPVDKQIEPEAGEERPREGGPQAVCDEQSEDPERIVVRLDGSSGRRWKRFNEQHRKFGCGRTQGREEAGEGRLEEKVGECAEKS